MPNIADTGFILRKIPYSESSLILKAYTREHGVMSFMAKGARRQNSRLHGVLEPGVHLQFLFPGHSRGEMRILADAAILRDFSAVRDDLHKLGLAQAFGEVLLKYLPGEARGPDFHDLMLKAFARLEESIGTAEALQSRFAAWLLDFCRVSGFQPQFRFCVRCNERVSGAGLAFAMDLGGPLCGRCQRDEGGSVRLREGVLRWLDAVQEDEATVEITRAEVTQAVDFLLTYLGRHAGGQKPLKSVAVWRGLMEEGR